MGSLPTFDQATKAGGRLLQRKKEEGLKLRKKAKKRKAKLPKKGVLEERRQRREVVGSDFAIVSLLVDVIVVHPTHKSDHLVVIKGHKVMSQVVT